ncbi:hypothetical protein [Hymenobacter sp. AT01-02]|uniref:hypothetical protein n=1 Tax=Hymenobacter sp. AT01-02 TaxID=1571877 RepID=UPI001F33F9BD|nr:hypothetical protein [Hymenobacter sp. AT01-02]
MTGCSKEEIQVSDVAAQASRSNQAEATAQGVVRRSHEYIILSATDALPADLASKTAAANGKLTTELPGTGLAIATSTDPDFAAKASRISGVRSVIHDFSYQATTPSRPAKRRL